MEKPLVIDAVIGNSRMLATLDRHGELHHLFWPDIDRDQQVGKTLLGIFPAGRREETLWLSGHGWEHCQEYLGDTAILHTRGVHRDAGLEFALRDFCLPGRSLLVRRLRVVNQGGPLPRAILLHYAALDLGGSPRLNACHYHPGGAALVYYRQDVVCAVGFDRPVAGYTCGREHSGGSALWDAADGHLDGRGIEMGDVDACLACDLGPLEAGGAVEVTLFWSWAACRTDALAGLEEARRHGGAGLEAETARHWERWLALGETAPAGEEVVDRVFRRSLVTIKLLSDAEYGGIIAAPEADPDFIGSGGYGYCWPRDAVWVASALTEAGHRQEADAFYRWARTTQEPDGCWYQRYYCNGSLAPSWGLVQADETASVLFGLLHHFALTQDRALLHEVWPMVRRGAEYLRRARDPDTGLPEASIDLWEERTEESAYTAAATYGAFIAAAYLAAEVGDQTSAQVYQEEAERLRAAILAGLWHPPDGRFLRGLWRRIGRGEYLHRRAHGEQVAELPQAGLYSAFAEHLDRGLDVSLLGLSVPFGVLSPRDPRMQATAGQIARHLENPRVGGIHRYSGDGYRGGNPWVICTLWMGLFELAAGEREKARERLSWAAAHRTSLDLLPEQVHGETGAPFWIIPLGWSHAMFIHLVLALRRRGGLDTARPLTSPGLCAADHH